MASCLRLVSGEQMVPAAGRITVAAADDPARQALLRRGFALE
jgi:hypothetical protein